MMMSHSRFTLKREISKTEDTMVNEMVSVIKGWRGATKDEICNTVLLAMLSTLITVDEDNAVTRLMEAAEAAAEMQGQPIAIFWQPVQHGAVSS
jgi:hypothetical protein